MTAPKSNRRHFHLTPGRFVLALLAVEVLLWLSDRFGWLGWHKGYAVLTGVASVGMAMLLMLVWFAVALLFRRRFQFSVRSLLVLVVVVAMPCSWLAVEVKRAKEQKAVVEAIRRVDGAVFYDHEVDTFEDRIWWIPGPERSSGPPWLSKLLGDEFFKEVTCLTFDAAIRALSVHGAIVRNDRFTDSELERLQGFTQLQWLDLSGTHITDDGLVFLRGMAHLESLDLVCTDISDAGLQYLEGMMNLKTLCLGGTHVTAEGVAKLQQALPNCKITR